MSEVTLIDKLRGEADIYASYDVITRNLLTQAATAIAAKEAENAELRAALETAANALAWAERRMACKDYADVIANDERNARAALGSDRNG